MSEAGLTVEEVAKLMRCSTRTIERRIASGDLPAVKTGRLVRVREAHLYAWMDRCTTATTTSPAAVPDLLAKAELVDAPMPKTVPTPPKQPARARPRVSMVEAARAAVEAQKPRTGTT